MSDTDFAAALDEALETLAAFAIPLYQLDENRRPRLHGTSFIVKRGDSHFLVSAAHVLDDAEAKGLFYYITPQITRKLSGRLFLWPSRGDRNKDVIDVGVLRLTRESPPPYPAVKKFAMLPEYLVPSYLPRALRSYAFIGFPETKSKTSGYRRTVMAAPYAFRCAPIQDEEYSRLGLDPMSHVALTLDLKEGYDASGNRIAFPKPQGMSGAPIVVLYNNDGSSDSRVFPVVAVATTYRSRDKVVFGTDVSYIIDAIERASADTE